MKILTLLLFLPLTAFSDVVVPIDEVKNNVNIRLNADASSEIVGKLDQGASAELVRSIDGWHEVKLEGGATGFVSADWSRVVESDADVGTSEDGTVVAIPSSETQEEVVESVTEPIRDGAEEVLDVVEDAVAEVVEETVEAVEETVTVDPDEEEAAVAEAPPVKPVVVPVVSDEEEIELKGTRNFLVKFRGESEGGNSQVYDNGNRIGIGTTEPKQRLEVNGSIQIHEQNSSVAGLMITQSSGDTGYIMHNRASTLTIGAGSQDRITIDRDGNVGIAVARPDHPLQLASGAHVTAGGVWTNSSSRERKENIELLSAEQASVALMALDPVTFNYRAEQDEEYVGFIAEDVPELLATGDRDALSAMDIVAVLTRVVQEQQKKIDALEEKLENR